MTEEDYRQHSRYHIPGFRDAPEWATWVQFCKQRGWVFYNKQPHVFSDGVASVSIDKDGNATGLKSKRAIETPNIVYLTNKHFYTGKGKPFDD